MLVHGFNMHRVYISAPGDLEREKQLCREVISEVNEAEAMKDKILLVSVGLREDGAVEQVRGPVADNIRQCSYFIQVFEDDWGPKNLMRKMFFNAFEAREDESLPMREMVVFIKDAPRETDQEILAFRKELSDLPDVRVFSFQRAEEMREKLKETTLRWVEQIRRTDSPVAATA